jgi:hypothetical protein
MLELNEKYGPKIITENTLRTKKYLKKKTKNKILKRDHLLIYSLKKVRCILGVFLVSTFVALIACVQCGNDFNNELEGHTIENMSLEFLYNIIDLGFSLIISNLFYFCFLFPFRGGGSTI